MPTPSKGLLAGFDTGVPNTPRSEVLHLIHDRGHLNAYLRLHTIPIPGIYGPSADTQPQPTAQLEQ